MQLALRPYITAGIALTGAGLIAVIPVALPLPPAGIQQRTVQLASGDADVSDNAFTIGGTTFDPGADGYNVIDASVGQMRVSLAPLLRIGLGSFGVHADPIPTQDLAVYDDGSLVGTAHTSVTVFNLLGIETAQFTVQDISPDPSIAEIQSALTNSELNLAGVDVGDLANALAAGNAIPFGGDIVGSNVSAALGAAGITLPSSVTVDDIAAVLNDTDFSADLPAVGTVYSITDLGSGWANVYVAVPNADGTAAASITDTLVTPFGTIDIPTDYDAIAHLDPGAALAGFAATLDNSDLSDNAFTIDGTTFDPGSDGFDSLHPLFSSAPLLGLAGGKAPLVAGAPPFVLAPQNLDVYNGDGLLGSVKTSVTDQNLLGIIDATQLAVTDVEVADGVDAADLPDVGTVYSVADFGAGFANVYVAIPNDDGTAAASITDTLVTPFGNIDIPTTYDAVAPMDPGAAFAVLGDAADLGSDEAFLIDGFTFDPGSDGFAPVDPLSGIAPLLQIAGGKIGATIFATQDLDVYGSSGTDIGSIDTELMTSNILGFIETTQLNVDAYNDVPASVYVTALDSDIDFTGAGFTASELVTVLEDPPIIPLGTSLSGGVLTAENITNALFFSGINLSAAGIDPADVASVINGATEGFGADAGLPDLGTVYSVTDFGGGFANIYVAVPGEGGAASITDTLVTPWGNFDILTDFDATVPLDPGDAAAGVTDVGSSAFDLFDPGTWF